MTANATIDCADTQGSFYCVDSSRDFYIKSNGTSLTSWQTSPLGTMIEATPDRMVVAGVAASPNTLFISGSNNFTNYTVGPLTTDPFNEVIAAPGSKITHVRWGCGRLLWWKDQSFGYFDFDDQYSAQIKTVSDIIGTFDNTSAIDPGGSVWFRGQDGHMYEYNCSGLLKQTIEITPQIQNSSRRSANSWTQSTQSDFSNGNFGSSTTYSSTAGGIWISTTSTNFSGNSFESNNWTVAPSTGGAFSQNLGFQVGDTCGLISPKDGGKLALAQSSGGSITATVFDSVSGTSYGSLTLTFATSCSYVQKTITVSAPMKTLVRVKFSSDVGNGPTQLYSQNFAWSGASSITFWLAMDKVSGINGYIIDFFEGGATTITNGLYKSAVNNANNLTSWSNFTAPTSGTGGTHAFAVRASTGLFTINSSTPNWVAQTVGATVAASTGTYFQMEDSFTVVAASETPTLNSFTFNWFEGSAGDQAYMLYFDNAIWASVTYGVGISSNNYIFRRDLINDGWTLYNFGAGGLLVQGNRLYFGSVADGNVYQFGSGTSDNGNAINAYWKSKDFTSGDPFMQSTLTQIDIFGKQNTGQTLTSTYTTDTSTTTSYTVNLSNSYQTYVQSRKLLPVGKTGYTFNLKLGDNTTSSAWEVFGFRLSYNTLPWRPTQ